GPMRTVGETFDPMHPMFRTDASSIADPRFERSPTMLAAALLSFGVIFLAELGDRSQLMTMTYALRHRWWVVLTGVGVAALVVHGISVAIGHSLGVTLPARPMAFGAAIAFVVFAVWTWREGGSGDDDGPVREPRFALLAVMSSFALAELSDKTMLATIALASDHDWVGVWIGTSAGMVVADGLAIVAGILLHRRLPEGFLHASASLLFLLFGLWLLFDGALGWRWVAVGVTGSTALVAATVTTVRFIRSRPAAAAVPAASERAV
ncbi:MAG: TMEM165/GDT1 family protein, partial [Pseudonocardiaceae bacterium]